MEYIFKPQGVCSREMKIVVEDNIIKEVKILGGCEGNTVGVARLIEGMNLDEAIRRLTGIPCGTRGTSCPDQLSIALKEIKMKMNV